MPDLAAFNQQLAALADASLPLPAGLRLIAADARKPRVRAALRQVADDLDTGVPLEEAFGRHRDLFPPLYARLVAAGIRTGDLPGVLVHLDEHFATTRGFRLTLWRALAYPLVILTSLSALGAVLLVIIVPHFSTIFEDFEFAIPLMTRALLGSAPVLVWVLAGVALAGLLTPIAALLLGRSPRAGAIGEALLRPLPIIGACLRRMHAAQWCGIVRAGLSAGLPLESSITLAADTLHTPGLHHDSQQLIDAAARGEPAHPARNLRVLPRGLPAGMAGAQSPAQLQQTFTTWTELLRRQAGLRIQAVAEIVPPLLLALIGLVIGFFALAMVLPLIRLMTNLM